MKSSLCILAQKGNVLQPNVIYSVEAKYIN